VRPLLACLLLLLAAAAPEPDGFRLDDYRAPVPDAVRGGDVVRLEAMRDVVARREALLIDVLPAPRRPESMRSGMPWRPAPHRSLPGAIWWPDVGRGALAASLEATFHDRLDLAVAGDRRRQIVFFCLSDCWMSWNAAKRAAGWGYRVAWYPDGVDQWEAAGLPTAIVEPEPLD